MSDKVVSFLYGVIGVVLCAGILFIDESMPIWYDLLQFGIGFVLCLFSFEMWDRVKKYDEERRSK